MSSRGCRRSADLRRWKSRAACALVAAFAWCAADAFAVTFYKWTDERGETHYGDAPPKQFAATAKRIDVDPGVRRAAPAKLPPVEEPAASAAAPAAPDILTQRRQTRARLEKNLEQAQERLDLARKALAETIGPQDDEWQTTLGRVQAPGGPAQVARSNCHPGPNKTVICPGRVPNEQYYQRIEKLQDEVHAAELALEDAERAYRQGVD